MKYATVLQETFQKVSNTPELYVYIFDCMITFPVNISHEKGKRLICWYFNVTHRYKITKPKVHCPKFRRNLLEEIDTVPLLTINEVPKKTRLNDIS